MTNRNTNRDRRSGRYAPSTTGATPPTSSPSPTALPPACHPDDPYLCESDHAPTVPAAAAYQAYKRRLITTSEAARQVGVTGSTMRRWIEEGHVKAVRIAKGGHWRVDADALAEKWATVDPAVGPYGLHHLHDEPQLD